MSAVAFVNILLFQWFRQGINRFYAEFNTSGKLHIMHQSLKANVYLYTVICIAAAAIGLLLYRVESGFWVRMLPIISMITLGMAVYELFSQYFIARLTPMHYGVANILRSVLSFVTTMVLILIGYDYKSLFAGLLIGYSAAIIYSLSKLEWNVPARFHKSELMTIAAYSLPLTVTAGLNFILGYINRFMIDYYGNKSDTGLFTFGYDFSEQTLGVLMAIASTSALPISMKLFSESGVCNELISHMRKSLWLLLSITLPLVCLLIGLMNDYSTVLFGEKFQSLHPLLIPIAAFSVIILGIKSYYLDQVFYFFKKTKTQTAIVAIAAIVNVLLNMIFIPRYGYIGAAYATLFSYSSATFITYFTVIRLMKVPLITNSVIKTLAAALALIILTVVIPQAVTLVALIVKLIILLAVYVAILFLLNRRMIMNYFKP